MVTQEVALETHLGKKIFSQEEAIQASLKYFNGDDLAARVWVNKYALKDSFGNIFELIPDDMHRRMAREIARIEKNYPNPLSEEEIYQTLKDFKYIVPQGGPMTGIGNNYQIASLSNCFVVGNEGRADSYGGILKIDRAGAIDETQGRRFAYQAKGFEGRKFSPNIDRSCAFYGALFQFDTRSCTGRQAGSSYAFGFYQASRCRKVYRRQNGAGKSNRSQCVSQD